MKKILKFGVAIIALAMGVTLQSCNEFEPTGYETIATLPKVSNLTAEVVGHTINVSWQLPQTNGITGLQFIKDADTRNPIMLDPGTTSYEVKGQPMGQEGIFTVKVCYADNHVSEGVSVKASLPEETLAGVSNLTQSVSGRTVTLSWTLPSQPGITGVRAYRDGDNSTAITFEGEVTSCQFKSQPMDVDMTYTVEVIYDQYYYSIPTNVSAKVPYIAPKMAYLLSASSWSQLPDDDERAAAEWFSKQENAEFVHPSQVAELEPDLYPVLWIEVDRVGLPLGWKNLPSEFSSQETIDALRQYTANGGNLYLSNMATQLTVPLGIVPDNMAPTVYGNGDGGTGDDVWVINPYLGWDFRNGSDQGFYDRTFHAIYKDLVLEDPNGYGYENLPLIGPGQREDHNCLWDCNIYGRGNYPDVIANFEATTGSLVLATWGHVRDHCVAGLVEFFPNANHGRCIANGFAAYEWNQNSGTNPYQHNVEQLTLNILNYLK